MKRKDFHFLHPVFLSGSEISIRKWSPEEPDKRAEPAEIRRKWYCSNFLKIFENYCLTFCRNCIILTYVIEAWLSLVERCVRDAEAACSNHVASMIPLA